MMQHDDPDYWKSLTRPFDQLEVKWRLGGRSMALAYIDARVVMDRLDDVCGPENWQTSHICADGKTICRIGIKIGDEWIWKSDGAGDTKIEADKGAVSDSIKRAAVNWGIGRYLYQVRAVNVKTEKRGNRDVISKGSYKELNAALQESAALNTEWGRKHEFTSLGAVQEKNSSMGNGAGNLTTTGTNSMAEWLGNTTGSNNTAVGEITGDSNTAVGNGVYAYTKYDKEGKPCANYTNFKSYKDNLEVIKFANSEAWIEATLSEFQTIKEWVEDNQPDHLKKITSALATVEEQIGAASNG